MIKRSQKPDVYKWGSIYQLMDLPKQLVSETTDGVPRTRDGAEQYGPHHAVVVSGESFNGGQSRGLIIVPMTSGQVDGVDKWSKPQPTWLRVRHQGELAFILCEQIRYVDRGRCGKHLGELVSYDLQQLHTTLRRLLGHT